MIYRTLYCLDENCWAS